LSKSLIFHRFPLHGAAYALYFGANVQIRVQIMRGRNHFKATDMKRASVEIGPDGRIVIVTKDGEAPAAVGSENEWDAAPGAARRHP
jgi:hypothetical protein